MSDRLAAKIKENAGKPKYSSLNLNQTYKGNKVEIKASTGATRHGLQSLGKIGSSRRIPPPANLPSLKSENSGNDPTVSLVPSGGGGWGSGKDKSESSTPQNSSPSTTPAPQTSQGSVPTTQPPLLQPQRPIQPSSYPSSQPATQPQSQSSGPTRQDTTTTTQEKSEAHGKTWGTISQSEAGGQAKPYSHQPTPYFNREFPSLGGQDNGETKPERKEFSHGQAPIIRNTHEPPWMERSGPGPPSHGHGRDHEMFNGGPARGEYHRRPPPDYQHRGGQQGYPPHHYNNSYHPAQGGRPPLHGYPVQDQYGRPYQRPGPGQRPGMRVDKRYESDRDMENKPVIRTAVLRPEDIQAMDDEDDDGGWAGAHGEVDYTAKLNFEDFDDEEKDKGNKEEEKRKTEFQEKKEQKAEEPPPAEAKKESDLGGKEPTQYKRPQDSERPPQQPKSAWGEPPQGPSQYGDGQYGRDTRSGPPQRPFDSHRPPPQGQSYHGGSAPWNMQYPPPQRAPQGQYSPVSGSPPAGRGPPVGTPPKQDLMGPPMRREGEPLSDWATRKQEMHAAVERARMRREQEELERQAKTKAAALMKLKELEERHVRAPAETSEETKEGAAEKPRADSQESGKSDRETRGEEKEMGEKADKDTELPSEQKTGHYPAPQHPDQKAQHYRPEDSPRRRNDSDSSDASRSSGSRQYFHHPQRNIPPRFQQQRQQQQQQYQQQQLYQATHPMSHPQREVFDVPPPHITDSGPVSPSSAKPSRPTETTAPKRIMKRTDSSSTAGDDVASVKSLDSPVEREKGSRQRVNSATSSISEQETRKPDARDRTRPGNSTAKIEDKEIRKEALEEKKRERQREKTTTEPTVKDRPDQESDTLPRKREYRSTEKKTEEAHKRKRDENEDDYDDRRNKITNRDRQTDGRGRTRPGAGYRGRGRGSARGRTDYRVGGSDNRQRGVRDTRQGRDSRDRDYRKDEKTERTREPLKSEDRTKDGPDKISSEERDVKGKTERPPLKKDERTQSDKESQERKTSSQEKTSKDSHEKDKGERRPERAEKRTDRYERRDERERVQRKPSDQRRTENKENKAETRKVIFPARDVREEDQRTTTRRSSRDGQDRRQDRDRNRDRDDYYKDYRPRDYRDRDRERMKSRDQDRFREAPRSSRGHDRGHRAPSYARGRGTGSARGGRRGTGRLVGSGRIGQRIPKKEELVSDEEDLDDSTSESSSYTTATSASEERIEEKEEKPKERPRSASQSGSTTRTPVRSMRASRARGGGGFPRPRREQEKPPRFQKQQERAAAQRGTSSRGVFRAGDRGRGGRGRGRGRGRGMPSTRDTDEREAGSIQPTEDWEDEVNQSPKEQDKLGSPQKRAPKSGDQYSSRKPSSRDESARQGGRRDGGQSSTHLKKTDSFLAEKQVKVEGSKPTTSESKGALPAAKSTDLAQGKKSSGTPKDEKRSDYSAVDNIDSKTQKRTDTSVKKANIQLYDLHNVAGVICIDDIPDDASDISSSGFVEVTSKRTQKEMKEKQREEDERKKRSEEKASQRSSDKPDKFKKNQANKPPRFSKQHQNASATGGQAKAVVSKLPSGVGLDGIPGLVSSGINSNSSSTNSTKRNSPVTVERAPSPQPPPVFNAWNKPLSLVTPAKAPGSSLAISSNVPDPLAVGSGKPSRHTQPSTVIAVQNSLINSNIEDKSAEDELKEITKEIESMAPTEEQEDVQEKTEEKSERLAASSGTRKRRHDGEKKSQPKPQRAPRFDKSSKRRNATEDGAKKEHAKEESKKDKSRLAAKQSDTESLDATSNTKRPPGEEETLITDETMVSDTKGSEDVTEDTPSEKKLPENDEADRESEKDSVPRKDSDYSVDSEEQASEDSSVFSSRPLSVDITESSGETQDRPPTPVSPIIAEMTKRMKAARMAWLQAPSTSVGLAPVSMETTSSWPKTSSPSVSIGSKDSSTLAESSTDTTSEYRENTEDSVSKPDVTKPTEVQFSGKKPGGNEQHNVCKVKPQQQQQPVKPKQSSSLSTGSGDDRGQADLESMVPTQPVLPQDHLLRQNVHNPYPFQIDTQLLLQQRQPQQFVHQPLQSLPQSAHVAANSYQLSAQMQQVRQPTSASSLSQSPQELFQAPFMTNNLYTASGFPVSQPYVSLTMVATTTTPSYVSTSTRTQATSVMALQGQQPKTMNSSMFGPSGSPAQTVYMPFDPQSMGGTATLLNFNQQSQQAQRQMMGNQTIGFADVIPQQALQHAAAGAAPQQIQNPFSFHTKPASFDSQQGASLKSVEPSAGEYNQAQSDMVKHINAKPFEPPKRLSTPTPSNSTANSGMGLLTSAVNPNLVHVGPSPPNMGALSHSPPMPTSYISNRPVSMSPVDPNVSFAAGANSFAKHAPMSHFQLPQQQRQQAPVQQFTPFQQQPVHIKPQQLQQHQSMNIRPQGQPNPLPSQQQHNVTHVPASGVPHQMIPRQYGHVGPSQPSVGNQRFPGPIQRPPTSGALQGMPPNIAQHQPRAIQPPRSVRQQVPRMPQAHKVPILSTRPQFQSPVPVSSQASHFKAMQHQKMLEETRMFFATDQQSRQKSQASVSEQGSLNEMKSQSLQQQGQKQGQVFPQTHAKQPMPVQPVISKHQNAPVQEGMKMSSQPKQSLQHKQVPLAPTSGVHHQNKPPRMLQENKPKQNSQDKKDKKEENKSHIIELPRKKPQDNMNKPKPNKSDSSKSEDTKQGNRMDGKPSVGKRSGPVRITPMIQKTPPGSGRPTRPTKPRLQVKNTSASVPPNKPKPDGTATTTVAAGAPSTAGTTTTTPKPPNNAVVSSKGKDIEESSPKDSEEVKATVNPLTAMTS